MGKLTVIKADMIWIIKSEIPARRAASCFEPDSTIRDGPGCYSQVLEHLRKPETLRFVDLRCVTAVHVIDPSKSRRRRQIFVETSDCTTCTVQVNLFACHAPSVEVAFEHFGSLDVICCSDVVTVFRVEG